MYVCNICIIYIHIYIYIYIYIYIHIHILPARVNTILTTSANFCYFFYHLFPSLATVYHFPPDFIYQLFTNLYY